MSASLILRTAGQFLLPLLLLFSIFLLLRGHNLPGGGFIAGLVTAAAVSLHLLAVDIRSARRVLRMDPRRLLGLGLLTALSAAMFGPLRGEPLFAAQWTEWTLPLLGTTKVGTPLLFDLGVYFVVIGAVLTIVLTLAESEE